MLGYICVTECASLKKLQRIFGESFRPGNSLENPFGYLISIDN